MSVSIQSTVPALRAPSSVLTAHLVSTLLIARFAQQATLEAPVVAALRATIIPQLLLSPALSARQLSSTAISVRHYRPAHSASLDLLVLFASAVMSAIRESIAVLAVSASTLHLTNVFPAVL